MAIRDGNDGGRDGSTMHESAVTQKELPESKHHPLELSEFEPKSMLEVNESHVERAQFPVIDFHPHITMSVKSENGVELSAARKYLGSPDFLLPVMDRRNIRAMINLPKVTTRAWPTLSAIRSDLSRAVHHVY